MIKRISAGLANFREFLVSKCYTALFSQIKKDIERVIGLIGEGSMLDRG
jgi:hypothetical protein